MKLDLEIAYDGGPYEGWQSQARGGSVQDALEDALARIAGTRVIVRGAGRTDAGVHALGQRAHVEVPDRLTPGAWVRALNGNLPPTVRILEARRAPEDFHARFSATGKIYRYLIRNQAVLPPLESGRVWHEPRPLRRDVLREAAGLFEGRFDFAAFSANRGDAPRHTVRTLRRIRVGGRGSLIVLTFEGEGFLYKMVRMLTGAVVRAAEGRVDVNELRDRLERGGPRWNHVAPACGLYLVKVLY